MGCRDQETRRWLIWWCPECPNVTDALGAKATCAGSVFAGTAHEPCPMKRLVVVPEQRAVQAEKMLDRLQATNAENCAEAERINTAGGMALRTADAAIKRAEQLCERAEAAEAERESLRREVEQLREALGDLLDHWWLYPTNQHPDAREWHAVRERGKAALSASRSEAQTPDGS